MSRRFLRCFMAGVLVLLLGALPWSSAQAAPADRIFSAGSSPGFGPAVARALHKLGAAFRLLLQQDQPNGNAPNGNPPNGNPPNGDSGGNPSGNSQDGVAIDPHGKPGPRGN